MTAIIGAGVSVEGLFDREFTFTFNAASDIQTLYNTNYGTNGTGYGAIATAAPLGLAVTFDTSADTQVKLAHDGDLILGVIERYEARVSEGIYVVSVRVQGGVRFPIATGHTVAVGDTVMGTTAYPGNVQTVTQLTGTNAQLGRENIVMSVPGDGTAIVLLR